MSINFSNIGHNIGNNNLNNGVGDNNQNFENTLARPRIYNLNNWPQELNAPNNNNDDTGSVTSEDNEFPNQLIAQIYQHVVNSNNQQSQSGN